MKRACRKELKASLLIIIFSAFLFSCGIRFNLNIGSKSVATSSNIAKEVEKIVYGDNIDSLEGTVVTLSKYKLPEVGDRLHGFKVNAIYDYNMRNAKVVLFEHEKTGAVVFLISNNDEDETAALGFNTLTFDDRGIPHVFEHACLGGSEKYPNANLFEQAVNRTYNTYMNAFTMQHVTAYPFSSLSDNQLFELYKFYIDGVFNPNVLSDEKNLEREAYRYTLEDKNDDIKLNGVVYSEMSGNEGNISSVAYRNSLKTMFNGSFMGMNTGGETQHIPEIELKDLVDFHEKYYHPSNMVIMLYGDIDYNKYLEYADAEYLSKYDKKEIDKSDPHYIKRNEFDVVKYDFPVASDSNIDGQTIIRYNVICEGMSTYESGIFELVLKALDNSDGPIKKRLLERLPDASFYVENNLFMPRPFFSITFNNVDESDSDIVKEIVEESFDEVKKSGISEDVLENILNYIEWDVETSKDSHGFSDDALTFYALTFSSNGRDMLGYLKYQKAMSEIEAAYKNGGVNRLIKTYLKDKNNFSMTVTVPRKGLVEENSEKLQNDLKKMKKNMTDEEINELLKKTKSFDEWAKEQASHSIIDRLRVATVSELDEYRAKCYAYEENAGGISFIRSDISDIKYNYYNLLFDISNLKIEDAMKLKFILSLLKELPTSNYPGQKIKAEIDKYTITNDAEIYVNQYYNGGYKPYFSFSCTSLDRNLDKAFDLMEELLYETEFEDIDLVRNKISSDINYYKVLASRAPDYVAEQIINVQTDNDTMYDYSISGTNYINFLKNVAEMNDSELRELLDESETIYRNVFNSSGLVCEIIGNFDIIKNIKTKVLNLSHGFKREKIVSNIDVATKSTLGKKIGVVVNGTMNYNYMTTAMYKDGVKYTGKYAVLGKVVDDKILYPEFRVKRSTYGSYSAMGRNCSYVYTYRDPNVKESFEVFNNLPKLIRGLKLSERELDDYKINAYATFAYPLTKMNAARIAVSETLSKVDEKRPDRYVRYMREIKEMKLDDIKNLSEIFDKMVKDGIYVTTGSKEKIEENENIFDEIIYDYIK